MSKSWHRFQMLHFIPVAVSHVLVAVDTRPVVLGDVVHPEGVLDIISSLLVFTQPLQRMGEKKLDTYYLGLTQLGVRESFLTLKQQISGNMTPNCFL